MSHASMQSVAGAARLSVDEAADVLQGLQRRRLIEMERDGIRLTESGRELGLHVLRAHRLWESYLADQTGFPEPEWHGRAHDLEHGLSPAEVDALSARLRHPTHDPHGDPIPTADGRVLRSTGGATDDGAGRPTAPHPPHGGRAQGGVRAARGRGPPPRHAGPARRGLAGTSPPRGRWDRARPGAARGRQRVGEPLAEERAAEAPVGEPLSALRPGEADGCLTISRRCRGAERRRLLDLGVLPGTVIRAELRSPNGDPTAYRIRDALIALRAEQADLIRIERLPEPTAAAA